MAADEPRFGSVRVSRYRGYEVEVRIERQTAPYGWVGVIRIWRRRASGPKQLGPWVTDTYPTSTVADGAGMEYAYSLIDGWLDE